MGFPTKNDHFGVFWGYHHFRKPPYRMSMLQFQKLDSFWFPGCRATENCQWGGGFCRCQSCFAAGFFFGGGGDQIPRIFDSSPKREVAKPNWALQHSVFAGCFFELNVWESDPGRVSGNIFFSFWEGTSRKTHNNQDPRPENGRSFFLGSKNIPGIFGFLPCVKTAEKLSSLVHRLCAGCVYRAVHHGSTGAGYEDFKAWKMLFLGYY